MWIPTNFIFLECKQGKWGTMVRRSTFKVKWCHLLHVQSKVQTRSEPQMLLALQQGRRASNPHSQLQWWKTVHQFNCKARVKSRFIVVVALQQSRCASNLHSQLQWWKTVHQFNCKARARSHHATAAAEIVTPKVFRHWTIVIDQTKYAL